MLKITENFYTALAEELLSRIDNANIFSCKIEFDLYEVSYVFHATIVPYYTPQKLNDDEFLTLTDIVPVWWDLRSCTSQGNVLNDFDFQLLKEELCQC